MRTTLTAALFAVVFFASASSFGGPRIGELAKPLDYLEYVDGKPLDLGALRGRPVVIYFGGDWCEPCVRTARPGIRSAAKRFPEAHFIVVAIDDNSIRPQKVREQAEFGVPVAMYKPEYCKPGDCRIDARQSQLGQFGRVYSIPMAYVLDSEGVVRHELVGGRGVADNIERALKPFLKK